MRRTGRTVLAGALGSAADAVNPANDPSGREVVEGTAVQVSDADAERAPRGVRLVDSVTVNHEIADIKERLGNIEGLISDSGRPGVHLQHINGILGEHERQLTQQRDRSLSAASSLHRRLDTHDTRLNDYEMNLQKQIEAIKQMIKREHSARKTGLRMHIKFIEQAQMDIEAIKKEIADLTEFKNKIYAEAKRYDTQQQRRSKAESTAAAVDAGDPVRGRAVAEAAAPSPKTTEGGSQGGAKGGGKKRKSSKNKKSKKKKSKRKKSKNKKSKRKKSKRKFYKQKGGGVRLFVYDYHVPDDWEIRDIFDIYIDIPDKDENIERYLIRSNLYVTEDNKGQTILADDRILMKGEKYNSNMGEGEDPHILHAKPVKTGNTRVDQRSMTPPRSNPPQGRPVSPPD